MPTKSEVSHLRALIRRHKGNQSDLAAELGITHQAVSRRIAVSGLTSFAAEIGQRNATGRRVGKLIDAAGERRRILAAIVATKNTDAAAERLGISRNTLLRRKKQLKITALVVTRARNLAAK